MVKGMDLGLRFLSPYQAPEGWVLLSLPPLFLPLFLDINGKKYPQMRIKTTQKLNAKCYPKRCQASKTRSGLGLNAQMHSEAHFLSRLEEHPMGEGAGLRNRKRAKEGTGAQLATPSLGVSDQLPVWKVQRPRPQGISPPRPASQHV